MNASKTVLLIEDDELIARAYKVGLEKEGIALDVAMDGQEGIEALRRGGYVLILLDLLLPKIDGFEVLAKAKKELGDALPPVIILSNLGQETDVERGKALGATDYLIKANAPMNEVVEKIRQYV